MEITKQDLIVATVELSYRQEAYRESVARFLRLGEEGIIPMSEAQRAAHDQHNAANAIAAIRQRFSDAVGIDIEAED